MSNSEEMYREAAWTWGHGINKQRNTPAGKLVHEKLIVDDPTKFKKFMESISAKVTTVAGTTKHTPEIDKAIQALAINFKRIEAAYMEHGLWPHYDSKKFRAAHDKYSSLAKFAADSKISDQMLTFAEKFPLIIKTAVQDLESDPKGPEYLKELYRFLNDTLFASDGIYGILEQIDKLIPDAAEEPKKEETAEPNKSPEQKIKNIRWFGDKGLASIWGVLKKLIATKRPSPQMGQELVSKYDDEVSKAINSIIGDEWVKRIRGALATFGFGIDGSFDSKKFQERHRQFEGLVRNAEDAPLIGLDELKKEIDGTYASYKKAMEVFKDNQSLKNAVADNYFNIMLSGKNDTYGSLKKLHESLSKLGTSPAPQSAPTSTDNDNKNEKPGEESSSAKPNAHIEDAKNDTTQLKNEYDLITNSALLGSFYKALRRSWGDTAALTDKGSVLFRKLKGKNILKLQDSWENTVKKVWEETIDSLADELQIPEEVLKTPNVLKVAINGTDNRAYLELARGLDSYIVKGAPSISDLQKSAKKFTEYVLAVYKLQKENAAKAKTPASNVKPGATPATTPVTPATTPVTPDTTPVTPDTTPVTPATAPKSRGDLEKEVEEYYKEEIGFGFQHDKVLNDIAQALQGELSLKEITDIVSKVQPAATAPVTPDTTPVTPDTTPVTPDTTPVTPDTTPVTPDTTGTEPVSDDKLKEVHKLLDTALADVGKAAIAGPSDTSSGFKPQSALGTFRQNVNPVLVKFKEDIASSSLSDADKNIVTGTVDGYMGKLQKGAYKKVDDASAAWKALTQNFKNSLGSSLHSTQLGNSQHVQNIRTQTPDKEDSVAPTTASGPLSDRDTDLFIKPPGKGAPVKGISLSADTSNLDTFVKDASEILSRDANAISTKSTNNILKDSFSKALQNAKTKFDEISKDKDKVVQVSSDLNNLSKIFTRMQVANVSPATTDERASTGLRAALNVLTKINSKLTSKVPRTDKHFQLKLQQSLMSSLRNKELAAADPALVAALRKFHEYTTSEDFDPSVFTSTDVGDPDTVIGEEAESVLSGLSDPIANKESLMESLSKIEELTGEPVAKMASIKTASQYSTKRVVLAFLKAAEDPGYVLSIPGMGKRRVSVEEHSSPSSLKGAIGALVAPYLRESKGKPFYVDGIAFTEPQKLIAYLFENKDRLRILSKQQVSPQPTVPQTTHSDLAIGMKPQPMPKSPSTQTDLFRN